MEDFVRFPPISMATQFRTIGLNFDIAGDHHQDTDNDHRPNILYLIRPQKSLTRLLPYHRLLPIFCKARNSCDNHTL